MALIRHHAMAVCYWKCGSEINVLGDPLLYAYLFNNDITGILKLVMMYKLIHLSIYLTSYRNCLICNDKYGKYIEIE